MTSDLWNHDSKGRTLFFIPPTLRSVHASPDYDPADSNLVQHATSELLAAGLFNEGSDYDGMTGQAVMELVTVFASQGHSGFSAGMVTEIFHTLSQLKPLSPLTDDPEEWVEIHDGIASEPEPLWQSRRQPSVFSHDRGKTYYDLNEAIVSPDEGPTMHESEKKSDSETKEPVRGE